MIELPEALARAAELKEHLTGKTVCDVFPPTSYHKFCWFYKEPEECKEMMVGKTVQGAEGRGIFIEIEFEDNVRLCLNDGTNARLFSPDSKIPAKYQLRIDFTDGWILLLTVAMYGGIACHVGDYDNEYYRMSIERVSPLSKEFDRNYFAGLLSSVRPGMNAKAFLATEQRIPGLGNGVLQDILYQAGIHPKRAVGTLSEEEREAMFSAISPVLREMAEKGGRDTERDIFGNPCGYRTKMSRNTLGQNCAVCGTPIEKATFLGGAVYYCPECQKL